MSRPEWTLEWTWGGERGLDVVEVAWTESVALFGGAAAYRRADLTLILRFDVAAHANAVHPRYATGILRRGSRIVLAGPWRGVSYGAHVGGGSVVELSIADDEADDRGTFPVVTPWRPTTAATRYVVYNTSDGPAADFTWDDPAVRMVDHGPVDGWDGAAVLAPHDVGYRMPHSVFDALAELTEGRGWPWPYGVGGTDTAPMTPAWVIDTNEDYLLIAGVQVDCAEVTILGPSAANADVIASVSGVSVLHATTSDGRVYAYVDLTSLSATLMVDAIGFQHRWWVTWPNAGRPGGAGDVLIDAYAASTLRVDLPAFEVARERLNRWKLAGYLDRSVTPSEWVRSQVLSIVPVSVVPGPAGLRPVLWPWLDGPDDTGRPLVDGQGIELVDPVRYEDGDEVGRVSFAYAVRADTGAPTLTAIAAAPTTAYGASGPRRGVEDIESEVVWDTATAGALAHARLRYQGWGPRTIRAHALDPRYDVGGDLELYAGDVVRLTSDRYGWTERPAVVARIERDALGTGMLEFWLRDDPLTGAG